MVILGGDSFQGFGGNYYICERRGIYDWGRIHNVNTAVTFIAEAMWQWLKLSDHHQCTWRMQKA